MKLTTVALLMLLIGCKGKNNTENINMPGAYKMLSQNLKNDKRDTTYTSTQQLKIFTGDYMMYVNTNPADSISSFGIGAYVMDKDTVVEKIIYTSADTTANETLRDFSLQVAKTKKGYKQIIPEIASGDQTYKLTEEYESVGTAAATALDGAWKLEKHYLIKGTDTTVQKVKQYKTYYSGHCVWGNTFKDSLNKTHTGIGFGKFEMTGNKVKESMSASTYSGVRGHDFDIDIELNGSDGFTQTIKNTDGTKSVEVYTRLKRQ
jgi:hypothetical protein